MEKLFDAVKTAYDPKNKPVHLCQTADGKFYVYKPSSGFKSRMFDSEADETLLAIFERQRHDGQTFASYLPGEAEEKKVKRSAADIIEAIIGSKTIDELEAAIDGDQRKTVVDAYEKRKAELSTPPAE